MINIRNKKMKSFTHSLSPILEWNTKDGISVVPKQDFLLHTTATHPLTNKALNQTSKLSKLGLLSLLPIGFYQRVHNIKIEQQMYILPSQETISALRIPTLEC